MFITNYKTVTRAYKMRLLYFKVFLFLHMICILSGQSYRAKFKKICGQMKKETRIVGGEHATIGEFPWMAHIEVRSKKTIAQVCGGSLITDLHVLTADHCLVDAAKYKFVKYLVVILGAYGTNSSACDHGKCREQALYNVEKMIPYKLIENQLFDDIAILQLTKSVVFTKSISPICLPGNTIIESLIGQSLIVIGWGAVDKDRNIYPEVLQKVMVNVKDKEVCALTLDISEGQICAGDSGKDSCEGDSGGPLFKTIKGRYGARYTQFGIVAYGSQFCGNGPAIYTDVAYYLEWIDGHLDHTVISN